ncbi:MAG TPA: hypothetical protein VNQ73_10175 [Ilumatobacter sp.]|nr:hypothetical protein [Ilumatobacter sp.]
MTSATRRDCIAGWTTPTTATRGCRSSCGPARTANTYRRSSTTCARAFEITPAFQERYGYPELTPAVKQRILAGNAIDLFGITMPTTPCRPVTGLRTTNRTFGPRSRRDVVTTFLTEHPWVRR